MQIFCWLLPVLDSLRKRNGREEMVYDNNQIEEIEEIQTRKGYF